MKSAKALSKAIARVDVSSPAAAAARAWEGGRRNNSHEWAYLLGQVDLVLAPIIADLKRSAREGGAS